MKIVHVYAQNLQIFSDALESTGCRINGSRSVEYLIRSLPNYNARDVMGLIVYRQHMTKKTLKLVKAFDELFVFSPLPIIIVCDESYDLFEQGVLDVKYSPLFLVQSVEGTISDIDLRRIFTTLSCMSDTMYDLSEINQNRRYKTADVRQSSGDNRGSIAEEVLREYALLGG